MDYEEYEVQNIDTPHIIYKSSGKSHFAKDLKNPMHRKRAIWSSYCHGFFSELQYAQTIDLIPFSKLICSKAPSLKPNVPRYIYSINLIYKSIYNLEDKRYKKLCKNSQFDHQKPILYCSTEIYSSSILGREICAYGSKKDPIIGFKVRKLAPASRAHIYISGSQIYDTKWHFVTEVQTSGVVKDDLKLPEVKSMFPSLQTIQTPHPRVIISGFGEHIEVKAVTKSGQESDIKKIKCFIDGFTRF